MTTEFSPHLDRLGDLIRRAGPEILYTAPLVTPEDSWFPDRWRPDLECVRRILLRLAEYAGMQDLDVEVVPYLEDSGETCIPETLVAQRSSSKDSGMFYGVHDGCAWFVIDERHLHSSQRLVGMLAHEMAHAWRRVHGIREATSDAEEVCIDLTTILLGFGILLCNADYEFRAATEVNRGTGRSEWSEYPVEGLDLDDMAGLLACWAKLKGLPEKAILRHLTPMQADAFREASARWSEDELRERLRIPADPTPDMDVRLGASRREFKPSRTAKCVHETVEQLVAAVGEDGGLVAAPIPFPAPVLVLPHRELGTWGRLSAAGMWARTLALVSDPEWDTQAIVLVTETARDRVRHALGHVRDKDARDAHRLHDLLAPAFRRDSPLRLLVAPQLPTFVAAGDLGGPLVVPWIWALIQTVADDADPDELAREAGWLQLYRGHTMQRLDHELEHPGMPHPPATGSVDARHWLRVVSNPSHVRDELECIPRCKSISIATAPAPPGRE